MELFDAHCDTLSRCLETGEGLYRNHGHLDLVRTGRFHPYAQIFAVFGDREEVGRQQMWRHFQAEYDLFRREMTENCDMIVPCTAGAGITAANQMGKAAALLSVEGADLLDCEIEKLEEAYRLGVRIVNLTWNYANALSGSHCDEPDRGLSQTGVDFARKMEQMGMLIDVSHLSDPGFWDVLEAVDCPVIASHSNARAVFFHTRNLTDLQITAIINRNGVIGLNLFPEFLGERADLDTVIRHLDHMLELGGEKTVAIGGDWDGITSTPEGIRDITGLELLHEELLRRNYSEQLVKDLFYFNMMRIVNERCST